MLKSLNDQQIQAAVLGSQTDRQAFFAWVYSSSGWREWVVMHVCENGGDSSAGEDVFQETLIIFDRNIREGRFRQESSLKTYFLGIAKQFWFNRRRNRRDYLPISENPEMMSGELESPEQNYINQERHEAVKAIIEALGEHCKKVLALYKLSLTNEEIARELGISNADMAKKYAYRCREKFRAYVIGRPQLIDLLNIIV